MLTAWLSIAGGLALLAAGAEGLVRGSSSIALRLGVTPLVVGLTIVAFGTGSPEMIVSLEAASRGNSDLALGNIVGSNIANIALILGVAALARPLRVRSALLRREIPIMVAVTVLLAWMLRDGSLGRTDGVVLVVGAVAYVVVAYLAARRDKDADVAAEFAREVPKTPTSTLKSLTFASAGLVGLLIGANLLVSGAVIVARDLGMTDVVIGLTVIAIGTSLPELAVSLVAALRDDADVALGNVIGSNILNILLILGVVAVVNPISTAALRPLDLVALIGTTAIIYPLLWRGSILNRWEGLLLVAGYAAYLAATLA